MTKYVIAEYDMEHDLVIHGKCMPPTWISINKHRHPLFYSDYKLATKFDSISHAASICNKVYTIYDFSHGLHILKTEAAESLEALWNAMES
jgi:hypothetical protein